MSISREYNVGAYLAAQMGLTSTTIASDTSSDADAQFGTSIDRTAHTRRYASAKLVFCNVIAVTNAKTLSVQPGVQDSADGSSWADYSTADWPSATVIGSTTTSASSTGGDRTVTIDVNLVRARRYVRAKVTHDFSASSSAGNTVTSQAAWVWGGADVVAAS